MSKPICWRCKRPAYEHCYSDAGRREVSISGLCEECFDEVTADPEDEETEENPSDSKSVPF